MKKLEEVLISMKSTSTVADSWTLEPSMPDPRLGHDAVTSNDKIYILGGKTNQSKDTVIGMTEIFIVDDVSNSTRLTSTISYF